MTATRQLTFAAPITAADPGRRVIAGRLVTYGERGNTSAGPTIIHGPPANMDSPPPRLVFQHDDDRPLGVTTALLADDVQLAGRFRVAATTAGNDALVEAAEGLRDGLSVGATVHDGQVDADGVLHVAAGGWDLTHVGLVTSPAFDSSRVAEVAAARTDPNPDPNPERDRTTLEGSTVAEHTEHTEQDSAAEVADAQPVAAAEVAAAPITAADPGGTVPVVAARDRDPAPITAGQAVQLLVAARQGDRDAHERFTAATGTADVAGLIPTPQAREVVGIIDDRRPVVGTVERGQLPAAGTQFQVPVRVTKAGVQLIADADAPALADSGSTFEWLDVDVRMFAGKDTLTVHAIERSDPSVLDDMLRQFAESYAQQTDKFVADGLLAAAPASSAGNWPDAIVQGIEDSAEVVRQAPEWLLLGLGGWGELKRLNAPDGRRVFPRLSERNAQGTLDGSPFTDGDAEGLSTRVSLNLADAATVACYPTTAGRYYEGAGIAQVRAMQVGALTWEIGVYGYAAFLAKYPTAVRKLAVAAPVASTRKG